MGYVSFDKEEQGVFLKVYWVNAVLWGTEKLSLGRTSAFRGNKPENESEKVT